MSVIEDLHHEWYVNINEKNCMITFNNENKEIRVEEVPEDLSWSQFFSLEKNFSEFSYKILFILRDIIDLENFLFSFRLS